MSKDTQLRAYWSKRESDLMLDWPLGIGSSSDGHWLSGVFDAAFMRELKSRGYKPETMRFSVEIDFDGPRADEKFPTLTREWKQPQEHSDE